MYLFAIAIFAWGLCINFDIKTKDVKRSSSEQSEVRVGGDLDVLHREGDLVEIVAELAECTR